MKPWQRPFAVSMLLKDVLFISHAVPAERVRRHVPPDLALDTEGAPPGLAYVSVGCFWNENFRWELAPFPQLSFRQLTYRTYVRHGEHRGVYFFATGIETAGAFLLERAMARVARLADFEVRRTKTRYEARVVTEFGITEFDARLSAKPAEPEFAQFITYRLDGYLESSLGALSVQKVRHARMHPRAATLRHGRFDLWEKLGILRTRDEALEAVLHFQPRILFKGFPPIPIGLEDRVAA